MNEQPLVDDDRSYSAFTFGYNRSLIAHRTADLLAIVAYAIKAKSNSKSVRLLGTSGAAPWVAPPRLSLARRLDRVAVETDGFRFSNVRSYRDVNFVPGAVKYGDLPALLALRAPHALAIVGDTRTAEHRFQDVFGIEFRRRDSTEHCRVNR